MCSIQLIDRMSRNNDLINDKENRLQEAINYYHQLKGEKGYSIRFVADYFGVCDTTLLRRLAKADHQLYLTKNPKIPLESAGSVHTSSNHLVRGLCFGGPARTVQTGFVPIVVVPS
jgi:hypothetical protein